MSAAPMATITLTIGDIGFEGHPSFSVDVSLDGKQVGCRRNLTPEQSQELRTFSTSYNARFEDKLEPRIAEPRLKALGSAMFEFWLGPVWAKVEKHLRPGGIRMLIIASDVADVLNLPWELLCPPDQEFLGLDARFGVRRLPWTDRRLTDQTGTPKPGPLRILFMACAPEGQPYLNYEQEELGLQQVMAEAGAEGVVLELADLGTFAELQQRIRDFKPHVVHLTGHAVVKDGQGRFCFEDEGGRPDLRSSDAIGQDLFAGSSVQCAFISGCQTGRAPLSDALAGICQRLVRVEVPLAIGYVASISDPAAKQFAAAVYHALAEGQSLDRAMVLGRQAIKAQGEGGDPSWTLPVLYASTKQAWVFDPDPALRVMPPRPAMVQRAFPGMTEGFAECFVDRRREIQRLLPALRSGKLQLVVITGAAGVGKSTLATRLARKLESEGFTPIAVASSKETRLSAARLLQTCADAFRRAGRLEARDVVKDTVLSVRDRLRYLVSVLNRSQFVLVFDDFDVNLSDIKDRDLALFYVYLKQHLRGRSRVLVTSRHRPVDLDELPSTMQEEFLQGLPEASFLSFLLADQTLEGRFYRGELSPELLSRLYQAVGRTPRFLDQMRQALKEMTVAELAQELGVLEERSVGAEGESLQQARDEYCERMFTERLYGHLSRESQRALSRAAVYGVPTNLGALEAVTGESEHTLEQLTHEWRERAFVYREPERTRDQLWVVGKLLRGWLVERLSPEERRKAHRAAGDYLSELEYRNREGNLGLSSDDCLLEARAQYLAAEAYERARAITSQVSDRLLREGLYSDLESINSELLEYDNHPGPMAWIGRAYYRRGEYDIARSWYERCLKTAGAVHLEEAAIALHNLGSIDLAQGNYVVARKMLRQSLKKSRRLGNRKGEAATWHQLATVDLEEGRYAAAREELQKALVIEQETHDGAGEAATRHQLATVDLRQGNCDAAKLGFGGSLELKKRVRDRAGEAATWHGLATVYLKQGDYEAARAGFAKSLDIRQQIEDKAGVAAAQHGLATVDLRQGASTDAARGFSEALEVMQSIGNRPGQAATHLGLAVVYLREGNYTAARDELQEALSIRQQLGDQAGQAAVMLGQAVVDLRQGNAGEALNKLMESLKIQQDVGNKAGVADTWHNLATIDLLQGDWSAARRELDVCLEMQCQIGNRSGEAAALHQLGSVDLLEGDYTAAREKLQNSLHMKQRMGNRAGEAATFWQLGCLAVRLEQAEQGLRLGAVCCIIEEAIGHGDAQADQDMLWDMASGLGYSRDRFDALLDEARQAYNRDRGRSLVEQAFGGRRGPALGGTPGDPHHPVPSPPQLRLTLV